MSGVAPGDRLGRGRGAATRAVPGPPIKPGGEVRQGRAMGKAAPWEAKARHGGCLRLAAASLTWLSIIFIRSAALHMNPSAASAESPRGSS